MESQGKGCLVLKWWCDKWCWPLNTVITATHLDFLHNFKLETQNCLDKLKIHCCPVLYPQRSLKIRHTCRLINLQISQGRAEQNRFKATETKWKFFFFWKQKLKFIKWVHLICHHEGDYKLAFQTLCSQSQQLSLRCSFSVFCCVLLRSKLLNEIVGLGAKSEQNLKMMACVAGLCVSKIRFRVKDIAAVTMRMNWTDDLKHLLLLCPFS